MQSASGGVAVEGLAAAIAPGNVLGFGIADRNATELKAVRSVRPARSLRRCDLLGPIQHTSSTRFTTATGFRFRTNRRETRPFTSQPPITTPSAA